MNWKTKNEYTDLYNTLPADGWLHFKEGRLLYTYAKQTTGPIVEIGSFKGRSTKLLSSLNRIVYCIDPWDDNFSTDETGEVIYGRFQENLKDEISNGIVIPIPRRVEDLEQSLLDLLSLDKPGLVYCDGDHTKDGTVNQLRFALSLDPQLIAVHDIGDSTNDSRQIRDLSVEFLGDWTARCLSMAIWKRD